MPSRFEVMAMWNSQEMDKLEKQLDCAEELDLQANALFNRHDELAQDGVYDWEMRDSAKRMRDQAATERQQAMSRADRARKLMYTAAPDHILVEMGFAPSQFEPLAARRDDRDELDKHERRTDRAAARALQRWHAKASAGGDPQEGGHQLPRRELGQSSSSRAVCGSPERPRHSDDQRYGRISAMSSVSIAPIVADCFTGSRISLTGPGYAVVATSTSMDDNRWRVSAEAEEVDAGIPTRINIEAHELARVMSELEGELQLVIQLELHLSPA